MSAYFTDRADKLGDYFGLDPIEAPKIIEARPNPFNRPDLWPAEEWEKMQRIARGEGEA